VLIALSLELAGVRALPFAVGMYLPISLSTPIFVGVWNDFLQPLIYLNDPQLFTVYARVKEGRDLEYVRDQMLTAFERFARELVPQSKLDQTRSRTRYGTALGWNSSEAIAAYLASYIALRGTPETIEKLFALYDGLTPENLRAVAARYFVENNRTIVTLVTKSKEK
jgi:zinc protease